MVVDDGLAPPRFQAICATGKISFDMEYFACQRPIVTH